MSNSVKARPPKDAGRRRAEAEALYRRVVALSLARDDLAVAHALDDEPSKTVVGAVAGMLARDVGCLTALAAYREYHRDPFKGN